MKKVFATLTAGALLVASASAQLNLVVTEVMSNSSHGGGPSNGDWWELYNNGSSAVDLDGYIWNDSNDPTADHSIFPSFTLSVGSAVVIVDESSGNIDDFVSDWGGGFDAISKSDFTGDDDFSGLGSSGDSIYLYNPSGTLLTEVTFGSMASPNDGKSFAWDTAGNAIAGYSVAGVDGAFIAISDDGVAPGTDVGSPGITVPEPNAFAALAGILTFAFCLTRRR